MFNIPLPLWSLHPYGNLHTQTQIRRHTHYHMHGYIHIRPYEHDYIGCRGEKKKTSSGKVFGVEQGWMHDVLRDTPQIRQRYMRSSSNDSTRKKKKERLTRNHCGHRGCRLYRICTHTRARTHKHILLTKCI